MAERRRRPWPRPTSEGTRVPAARPSGCVAPRSRAQLRAAGPAEHASFRPRLPPRASVRPSGLLRRLGRGALARRPLLPREQRRARPRLLELASAAAPAGRPPVLLAERPPSEPPKRRARGLSDSGGVASSPKPSIGGRQMRRPRKAPHLQREGAARGGRVGCRGGSLLLRKVADEGHRLPDNRRSGAADKQPPAKATAAANAPGDNSRSCQLQLRRGAGERGGDRLRDRPPSSHDGRRGKDAGRLVAPGAKS